MKCTPLFVSYFANWKGDHRGWLVFENLAPIETGSDVTRLCELIEEKREWPRGVVTISSFQRLESADPVSTGKQP